jgi:hypothetical protein
MPLRQLRAACALDERLCARGATEQRASWEQVAQLPHRLRHHALSHAIPPGTRIRISDLHAQSPVSAIACTQAVGKAELTLGYTNLESRDLSV